MENVSAAVVRQRVQAECSIRVCPASCFDTFSKFRRD
jgi:hypothetical protein